MEAGIKRKRDAHHPRVTYHAPGRTFDRLFKEESLQELKDVVRKKMNLLSINTIKLVQLRGGTEIDLEDDDDFDAFFSAAQMESIIDVRVTLTTELEPSPSVGPVEKPVAKAKGPIKKSNLVKTGVENQVAAAKSGLEDKKKQREKGKEAQLLESEPETEHEDRVENATLEPQDVEPPAKRRRVSFAPGDSTPEKKNRAGTNPVKDTTVLPSRPELDAPSRASNLTEDNADATSPAVQNTELKKKKRKKTTVNDNASAEEPDKDLSKRTVKPKRKKRRKVSAEADDTQDQTTPAPAPAEPSATDTSGSSKPTIDTEATKKNNSASDHPTPSPAESPTTNDTTEKAQGKKKKKKKGSSDVAQATPAPSKPSTLDTSNTKKPIAKKSQAQQKKDLGSDHSPTASTESSTSSPPKLTTDAIEKSLRKKKSSSDVAQDRPASAPTEPSSTSTSALQKPMAGATEKIQAKKKGSSSTAEKPGSFEAQLAGAVVQASGGVKVKRKNSKAKSAGNEAPEEVTPVVTTNVQEESPDKPPDVGPAEGKKVITKSKAIKVLKSKEAKQLEKETASALLRATLPQATLDGVVSSLLSAKKETVSVGAKEAGETSASPVASRSKAPRMLQSAEMPSTDVHSTSTSKAASSAPTATAKPSKTSTPCPFCLQIPFHARHNCPVVVVDIKGIEKRLSELKNNESGDTELQKQIVSKLQSIVDDRKLKEGKINNVNGMLVPSSPPAAPSPNPAAADVVPSVAGAEKEMKVSPNALGEEGSGDSSSNSSSSDESEVEAGELPYPANNLLMPEVDISRYTEKDLEDLVHGPNRSISAANIPLPESSDEENDESQGVLEEEDESEDARKYRRQSRAHYAKDSSEEDGNDEDEDKASEGCGQLMDSTPPVVQQVPDDFFPGDNTQSVMEEDPTFEDVNDLGSSMEVDKSGDVAFSDALAEDNAVFHLANGSDATSRSTSASVEISTAIGEAEESNSDPTLDVMRPLARQNGDTKLQEANGYESIEAADSSDIPISSPIESPDAIVSSPAKESTPKPELMRRLTSLRKRTAIMSPAPRPSARNGEQKEDPVIPDPTQEPETPGPRRSTRASSRTASQMIAPPPSQRDMRARSVNPVTEPPADAKSPKTTRAARVPNVAAKRAAKAVNKKQTKNKAVAPIIEGTDIETEKDDADDAERARWETLKQSSEGEADTTHMIDELHSSPSSTPAHLRRALAKQKVAESQSLPPTQSDTGDELQHDPLFLPSESQVPFPYSQPAEIASNGRPMNGSASPNESEDEEEVAAEITQSQPTSAGSQYRRLTDIASQRSLFPRPSLVPTVLATKSKDQITELYGNIGHDSDNSEESDSGSSDDEKEPSHIPKSRRAGAAR